MQTVGALSFPTSSWLDDSSQDQLLNYGVACAKEGDIDRSIRSFSKLIHDTPENALALYNRACSYLEDGKYDLAMADLNRSIDIDKSNEKAFHNRGYIYHTQYDLDNPDGTISDLEKNDIFKTKNLDKLSGKAGLALADYNAALGLEPRSDLFINRGHLLQSCGYTELALEDYNRAVEIDRGNAKAYLARGAFFTEGYRAEAAISDLDEAIRLNPKEAGAFYYLGVIYNRGNQIFYALINFKSAVEINPKLNPIVWDWILRYNNKIMPPPRKRDALENELDRLEESFGIEALKKAVYQRASVGTGAPDPGMESRVTGNLSETIPNRPSKGFTPTAKPPLPELSDADVAEIRRLVESASWRPGSDPIKWVTDNLGQYIPGLMQSHLKPNDSLYQAFGRLARKGLPENLDVPTKYEASLRSLSPEEQYKVFLAREVSAGRTRKSRAKAFKM